jgi:hypothetical protein
VEIDFFHASRAQRAGLMPFAAMHERQIPVDELLTAESYERMANQLDSLTRHLSRIGGQLSLREVIPANLAASDMPGTSVFPHRWGIYTMSPGERLEQPVRQSISFQPSKSMSKVTKRLFCVGALKLFENTGQFSSASL